MKITAQTTLKKILDLPAQAGKKNGEDILAKHGVPCVSCPMAKFEMENLKIGEICKMYKLPLKDILADLNKK